MERKWSHLPCPTLPCGRQALRPSPSMEFSRGKVILGVSHFSPQDDGSRAANPRPRWDPLAAAEKAVSSAPRQGLDTTHITPEGSVYHCHKDPKMYTQITKRVSKHLKEKLISKEGEVHKCKIQYGASRWCCWSATAVSHSLKETQDCSTPGCPSSTVSLGLPKFHVSESLDRKSRRKPSMDVAVLDKTINNLTHLTFIKHST